MAELIKFEVQRLPGVRLIGKEIRYSMEEQMKGDNRLPGFWDKCFVENIFAPLEAQAENIHDSAYVGVMLDWDKGDGDFSYIVGMLMKQTAAAPEGYFCRDLPETDAAVGWIRGKNVGDVCSIAHEATESALKENGRADAGMKWCMELYSCPRFTEPDENGDIILDYYIPLD